MKILILFILCLLKIIYSAPIDGKEVNALNYLAQFGYMEPKSKKSGRMAGPDAFRKAIEEFQSFAGIEVTGELDDETKEVMALPRCGVRDKLKSQETNNSTRSKRYVLQGSRWKVRNLTYKIITYPKKLDRNAVEEELHRAFSIWSDFTDLIFTPSPSKKKVNIEISFVSDEHGDGDPFDGTGGTLAHAYFPLYGGNAHFDGSEKWSINSYSGTNLFQVASHEFGHSLGLSHSDIKSALMAPFYRGYNPLFELDEDDIRGIQALYGKKSKPKEIPTVPKQDYDGKMNNQMPTLPPGSTSILCKDPKIDTIFNTPDGNTYVFKGDKYWKLTEESIAPGFPKFISEGWPGLPSDINGAFTHRNNKTYFFKGAKYWRYHGRKLEDDFPKPISEGFPGIPNDIDSVMVWGGYNKVYFFKGSKFWRYNPSERPPVKKNYPRSISKWRGVPDNLDAAFQWTNGYTYFYKDSAYYRFNDGAFRVDETDPAFPRSSAYWWFGCKEAPKGTISVPGSKSNMMERDSDDSQIYKENDKPRPEDSSSGNLTVFNFSLGSLILLNILHNIL